MQSARLLPSLPPRVSGSPKAIALEEAADILEADLDGGVDLTDEGTSPEVSLEVRVEMRMIIKRLRDEAKEEPSDSPMEKP